MQTATGVLRHSWLSSCLVLAACAGGGQKTAAVAPAPGYYGGGSVVSSPAYEPAPPPPSSYLSAHAAETPIAEAQPVPDRPGLGTSYGESVYAPISFAPFIRASASPWAEVALHYNDADGVNAHAQYLGMQPQPLEVFAGDGSLAVALVDEMGRTLPGFTAAGRTLIMGADGERYKVIVRNATTARFEVVASVDGLDVIDGKPADPNRRGYIVDPHDTLVIDGFRTSDANVAAFRFGRVADSYAARTSGDRNVGVIGLAIFAERGAVWTPAELYTRDTANPFPSRGYAVPPR
jgi:hypothetical protein